MIGNNACALCSQSLEPILAEGEHWRLVLNRNQVFLGIAFSLCAATARPFLQNQDRHVHLHVIPRYATPRVLAGEMFPDAGYPDHYAVGHPARVVPVEAVEEIVEKLRQAVMEAQARKT